MGSALVAKSGELAATAAAAKAKAMVEAAYVMAYQRPRSLPKTEAAILQACERYEFAETAMWNRIVGRKQDDKGTWVDAWGEGLSIRFAEVAVQAMTNIHVSSDIIYEDEEKRIIKTTVLDLESNAAYSKDSTLTKRVERSKLKKGQDAISTRRNSNDALVYIVAATDMELDQKQARVESILIRTNSLRLIPEYIKAACIERIKKTLNDHANKDIEAARARVCDALKEFGAQESEIVALMGTSVRLLSAEQVTHLRGLYRALKDKQTTWAETMENVRDPKAEPERGHLKPEDLQGVPESEKPPVEVKAEKVGSSLQKLWDDYLNIDLKKRKASKECLAQAKMLLGDEYGMTDLAAIELEQLADETRFLMFLARCSTTLEEEEFLK